MAFAYHPRYVDERHLMSLAPEDHDFNNSNHNITTPVPLPSSVGYEIKYRGIVIGILIGIIAFLSLVLVFLVGPPLLRYLRSKIPVSQKRINRRYETIEQWIISKKVRCHDGTCAGCKRRSVSTASSSTTTTSSSTTCLPCPKPQIIKPCDSCDTAETVPCEDPLREDEGIEAPLECSICLEAFQASDILSWSTNKSCSHVFHHECIKEWLLRRPGCPYCRETFLVVDDSDTPRGKRYRPNDVKRFIDTWRMRIWTTYFCLQEGLVELPDPDPEVGNLSTETLRLVVPRVKKEELVQLRGSRVQDVALPKTTMNEDDGVVSIPSGDEP